MKLVNPLRYWCPPNSCTPEHLAAHSMEDFLAYGLLRSWIDPADTICPVTPEDVSDLREGFLNCVEDAVTFWHEQEIGEVTGCDPAQPTVTFDLPDDEFVEAGWLFERVDEDALLFVLFWSGADDLAIWLAKDAVEGKEEECLVAVQKAREILGQRKV
jgi:hypothetical protein